MGYEKRGIRPFDSLDNTQTLLNEFVRVQCPPIPDGFQPPLGNQGVAAIGVDRGHIAGASGTLLLSREQYVGDAIGLYFGTNDYDWARLTTEVGQELDQLFGRRGLAPVSVVVTLTNTRLKQLEVLSAMPFRQWETGEWRHIVTERVTGTGRPRALRMPADGCVLGVRFLLDSDLDADRRIPGRPWRKGSWLARVDINISSAKGGGLSPRPMNDEIRERFGLGEFTTLYVDVRTECSGLHAVIDLAEVLTVYIDEEILKLAAEQDDKGGNRRPAGGPLINRWVLDTYRTLIEMYARDDQLDDFNPDDDTHRRTFLYSMLSNVEEHCHIAIEEAKLILRDQPNRFAALYENVLRVKTDDLSLLALKR